MDPQANLRAMLEAIQDKDQEQAIQLMEDLRGWLTRGGYLPWVEANPDGDTFYVPKDRLKSP